MIVRAGNYVSSGFSSGGRYDPSTDSGRPTSLGTNVPAARISHIAVWSGNEMLVWGGYQSQFTTASYLSDGGRSNPLSDTWFPISTGFNVPQARAAHTAAWNGSEMSALGGNVYTTP